MTIEIDGVRNRLAQLEREIEGAQAAARSALSIAAKKQEELQRASQEALAAQKTADDANAILAAKKSEYERVLRALAEDLQK